MLLSASLDRPAIYRHTPWLAPPGAWPTSQDGAHARSTHSPPHRPKRQTCCADRWWLGVPLTYTPCSSCRALRGCVRRRSRRQWAIAVHPLNPVRRIYDRFAIGRSLARLGNCYRVYMSAEHQATIDQRRLAGHVVGVRAGQVGDEGRDVFWGFSPAQGNPVNKFLVGCTNRRSGG